MRRADRTVSVATGVRGIAPARRRLASPLARGAAGLFGWLLAVLLLLPHAVLLLVSLVPAFTWTAEPFPPVLNLGNWKALFTRAGAPAAGGQLALDGRRRHRSSPWRSASPPPAWRPAAAAAWAGCSRR